MFDDLPPSDVRTKFDIPRTSSFLPLGSAGGFSGARFWQVETIEETYCLRRWPQEHPDREKLEWIHRVMLHAEANGCPVIETPLMTTENDTFVTSEGHFWQLSQWLDGEPNFSADPNETRLANAIEALAQFHLAAAQVSLDFRASNAIVERLGMLKNMETTLSRIESATADCPTSPDRARRKEGRGLCL